MRLLQNIKMQRQTTGLDNRFCLKTMEMFPSHDISSRWGGCWREKIQEGPGPIRNWLLFRGAFASLGRLPSLLPGSARVNTQSECLRHKLHSQRPRERKFGVSLIKKPFLEAPGVDRASLGSRVYRAWLDPHLATISPWKELLSKTAHSTRLLSRVIFVSGFCAACTIS